LLLAQGEPMRCLEPQQAAEPVDQQTHQDSQYRSCERGCCDHRA